MEYGYIDEKAIFYLSNYAGYDADCNAGLYEYGGIGLDGKRNRL